jgi:hypothetical protein
MRVISAKSYFLQQVLLPEHDFADFTEKSIKVCVLPSEKDSMI